MTGAKTRRWAGNKARFETCSDADPIEVVDVKAVAVAALEDEERGKQDNVPGQQWICWPFQQLAGTPSIFAAPSRVTRSQQRGVAIYARASFIIAWARRRTVTPYTPPQKDRQIKYAGFIASTYNEGSMDSKHQKKPAEGAKLIPARVTRGGCTTCGTPTLWWSSRRQDLPSSLDQSRRKLSHVAGITPQRLIG